MNAYFLAAKVGLAVVLAGLVVFAVWRYGDKRYEAGQASIQVRWDADKAQIAAVSAKAIAEANQKTADALEENRRLHDEYTAKLESINAGASDLARRLRGAEDRAAADRRALQEIGNRQGSSPSSQAPSDGSLDAAIAATLTECRENSAQLDTLVGEVSRQLD